MVTRFSSVNEDLLSRINELYIENVRSTAVEVIGAYFNAANSQGLSSHWIGLDPFSLRNFVIWFNCKYPWLFWRTKSSFSFGMANSCPSWPNLIITSSTSLRASFNWALDFWSAFNVPTKNPKLYATLINCRSTSASCMRILTSFSSRVSIIPIILVQ